MFSCLYAYVETRVQWYDVARSCIEFIRGHGEASNGKLYFTVTREGLPLRMRRYAYSEAFASIANAAFFKISGDERAQKDSVRYFTNYLKYNFTPGMIPDKVDSKIRPSKALGPRMIGIGIAQQLREHLGDVIVMERSCTEWIAQWIQEISSDFLHFDLKVLLEMVSHDGKLIDHFDGRTVNPGHAIEAAWFIMHEGFVCNDWNYVQLGETILDWMWQIGWDQEYGGIYYFRDAKGHPVQEYWHDMKFWWPHNEAIIATLLASYLTGNPIWVERHRLVHEWSFSHFPDREYGEWYGYLHRDGSVSVPLKGNMWKGPFHLPRMLLYCSRLLLRGEERNE